MAQTVDGRHAHAGYLLEPERNRPPGFEARQIAEYRFIDSPHWGRYPSLLHIFCKIVGLKLRIVASD
jgi:hypothetical protein